MQDNEASSGSEIEKAFPSSAFILKTQCQIAKDFANHGFHFESGFETEAYETERLKQAVQLMLSGIVSEHPSKWLPLMYSLDISEKNYVLFFENAHQDWLSDFAMVVIRREAQKVFFRENLK